MGHAANVGANETVLFTSGASIAHIWHKSHSSKEWFKILMSRMAATIHRAHVNIFHFGHVSYAIIC